MNWKSSPPLTFPTGNPRISQKHYCFPERGPRGEILSHARATYCPLLYFCADGKIDSPKNSPTLPKNFLLALGNRWSYDCGQIGKEVGMYERVMQLIAEGRVGPEWVAMVQGTAGWEYLVSQRQAAA